jgi:hypothetical protein
MDGIKTSPLDIDMARALDLMVGNRVIYRPVLVIIQRATSFRTILSFAQVYLDEQYQV